MKQDGYGAPSHKAPGRVTGMLRRLPAALLLVLLVVAPGGRAAAEKVMVFTYHTHPPFTVGAKRGLTSDLAAYLTGHSGGLYTFEVREMSRPALNKRIDMALAGMVPWVNPVWFKDQEESKYLWSAQALMHDGNAVISRSDRRVVYKGPASLGGMILGGLKGHLYAGIDDYIRETKSVRRVDTNRHLDNFRKLLKGRIDVTLTPKSAALYLIKREGLGDKLFVSPHLHSQYERRFFVTNQRQDIRAYIDQAFSGAAAQEEWNAILQRYR